MEIAQMRSLKMCFFACFNRYGNTSLAFTFRRIGMAHGESYCLPPMWPWFNSGLLTSGLRMLLVLVLSSTPVFLPPEKPLFPNSDSFRTEDPHENQLELMWLPPFSLNIKINNNYGIFSNLPGTGMDILWNHTLLLKNDILNP